MAVKEKPKKNTESLHTKTKDDKDRKETKTVEVQCECIQEAFDCGNPLVEKQTVKQLLRQSYDQEIDRSQSPLLPWEDKPLPIKMKRKSMSDENSSKIYKLNGGKKVEIKFASTKLKTTNFLKKNATALKTKRKTTGSEC